MDEQMSKSYEEFIERRDALLTKTNRSALELAEDIVELLSLIAIHGSSGMGSSAEKRQLYVERFTQQIVASANPDQ